MKLPTTQSSNGGNNNTISAVTSSKPTSTFNICDILELNSKKKKNSKNLKEDHERTQINEQEEEEEIEKKENLSGESEENLNDSMDEEINSKRKCSSASPASQNGEEESSQDLKILSRREKLRKHSRSEENSQLHQNSLLSDTIHQYPHLFQNHPAMRPWFTSNGKLQPFSQNFYHKKQLIEHIKSEK